MSYYLFAKKIKNKKEYAMNRELRKMPFLQCIRIKRMNFENSENKKFQTIIRKEYKLRREKRFCNKEKKELVISLKRICIFNEYSVSRRKNRRREFKSDSTAIW